MPDSAQTGTPEGAVFLSYASQDAEAARRICEALCAAGIEVWFDQSELRGGDAWDAKIRKQIKDCALFVPIISANTQGRPEGYFRLEWRLADQRTHLMGRKKAFLLPVCVDRTPDADADVPDSFSAVQWTRLPDGETPVAFAGQVRRLLGGSPPDDGVRRSADGSVRPDIAAPTADPTSVAVLAFSNLSNDKDNEYFSDGISEELLNVLANVRGLKVSARTSAFHFKGKDTPIPEIARQLGVAYVIEGSVRRAGDRVRITAQLVKAADGFHVWSDTFTRDLRDIFAVQDEIAGLIAKNLSLKLGATSPARVVNPEAYRLFLQGRAIFNREVPDEYAKAIECYRASLAIDGGSALTWACLSQAYFVSTGSGTHTVETGYELAREAAQRAIALDPEMAKGHGALAIVYLSHEWDWVQARTSLERAAALAPGDAETVSFQALLAIVIGQTDQAVLLGRKALELDPLNYFSAYALVRSLFNQGDFAEMEKQIEHLMALNPSVFRLRLFLAFGRLFQGRIDAAAEAVENLSIEWARLTGMACVRFAQGRLAESDSLLSELKAKHGKRSAFQAAEAHAFRNEPDEAFAWLETSFRQRDAGMMLLKCDQLFRNLHTDPRWLPLLRKMNLADDQLT